LGYLQLKQHVKDIMTLEKRDFRIRRELELRYPDLKGKIRFVKVEVKGKKMIKVVRQLQDEIIPKMRFKTINKFNNLHVSIFVLREFRIIGHPLQAVA